MGYFTAYEISCDFSEAEALARKEKSFRINSIRDSNLSEEIKNELIQLAEEKYRTSFNSIDYANYFGFDPFGDTTKWYGHEHDMRALSEEYPGVLFTLTGYGEESGDVWRKYFRDGRMQLAPAKIIFEDFNPSKLK
jgi:hypothetical protein